MSQRLAIAVGLSVLVLLPGSPSRAEEPVLTLAPGVPTLVVVPASTPLSVDGVTDEAAWAGAPRLVLALSSSGPGSVPGNAPPGSMEISAVAAEAGSALSVAFSDATYDVTRLAADALQVTGARVLLGVGDETKPIPALAGASWSACPEGAWQDRLAPSRLAWSRGRWSGEVPSRLEGPFVAVAVTDPRRGRAQSPWMQRLVGRAPTRADFEGEAPGSAPAGLEPALAGQGAPPAWVVREEPGLARGKRVLVQESQDRANDRFPIATLKAFAAADVDLSVRFQARDGFKDRGAGLIWRVKDAQNHYILRANALEQNVVLYKMEDGLRVDLPPVGHEADYGTHAEFAPEAWHTLRVTAVGERFQAYLDGRLLFEVVDKTFAAAGGVGVWTKSDSVMAFDDLVAVPLR